MQVVIISGGRGEGKTTFLKRCVEELNRRERVLFGFYADNVKTAQGNEGYHIYKVNSGESMLLCQRDAPETGNLNLADFWFDEQAIKTGEQWLQEGVGAKNSIFVLDEAGKFELDGHVWDKSIQQLLQLEKGMLLMTVRDRFLKEVMNKYGLNRSSCRVVDNLLFTVKFIDEID